MRGWDPGRLSDLDQVASVAAVIHTPLGSDETTPSLHGSVTELLFNLVPIYASAVPASCIDPKTRLQGPEEGARARSVLQEGMSSGGLSPAMSAGSI